jgi:RNase P subunit RPR2
MKLRMRLTLAMKTRLRNYYSQMCSDEEKNLRPTCVGCGKKMRIHREDSGCGWQDGKNGRSGRVIQYYNYSFSCENSQCLMSKEGKLSKVGAEFVKVAIRILLIQAGHDPTRMDHSADEDPIGFIICKNCGGKLYYDDWNKKPEEFIRGLEYCCPRKS